MVIQTGMPLARLIGSPVRFEITERAAALCLLALGTIVRHDALGSLLCKEIVMNEDGCIREVLFIGTSDPSRFSLIDGLPAGSF